MNEADLRVRVRELRAQGRTPKTIARALGLRPAQVAGLVRAVAADKQVAVRSPELAGCWVSPGWSSKLAFEPRPDWPENPNYDGPGLAAVLVARRPRHHKLSVCGYLVDTFCLGVKNALGPLTMDDTSMHRFKTTTFFGGYDADPLPAPLDLAQDLVFGALDYARGLGFEPHPDFAAAQDHLGTWHGPSPITFGMDGKPCYIAGPHDDPDAVVRTLNRTVGHGNYDYLVSLGPPELSFAATS